MGGGRCDGRDDRPRRECGRGAHFRPVSERQPQHLPRSCRRPEAGTAEDGRYLTLAEALASGEAVVFETGDVNQLEVQNTSKDQTLFIQAGDIVKGGRQDRVLSVDLILPPGSGKTPITAFCVEHGRWSARGTESAQEFASAEKSLAGKELRLAAKSARSQQGVWDAVAKTQEKLAAALGAAVAEPSSPTSLQLTLENERVAEAVDQNRGAIEADWTSIRTRSAISTP